LNIKGISLKIAIKNREMNICKCPNCETEFKLGAKFCLNCGYCLEKEFIENPTCPECEKTFPTGTKFCSEDGSKLVSPEKLIPRCAKCGKEFTDGTKYCPNDGGKVFVHKDSHSSANEDNSKNSTSSVAKNINSRKSTIDDTIDMRRQQIIINQTSQQSNGVGTAGFVIALIALIFCWVPGVGFVVWFIGLLLSFIGLFKSPRGLAITGFIISLIDLIILIAVVGAVASIFL